jgi:hypothetical protein
MFESSTTLSSNATDLARPSAGVETGLYTAGLDIYMIINFLLYLCFTMTI